MIYMTTPYCQFLKVIDRSSPMLTIAKQTIVYSDGFTFGLLPREVSTGNRKFVPVSVVENVWIRKTNARYSSLQHCISAVNEINARINELL